MKLKDIVRSEQSLVVLQKIKLPAVISYKVGVLIKQLVDIMEPYHTARMDLVKELGDEVKDDKGKGIGRFNIKPENEEKFKTELDKLEAEEVKINIPEIKIKDFGNIEIEPEIFVNLNWLIKE